MISANAREAWRCGVLRGRGASWEFKIYIGRCICNWKLFLYFHIDLLSIIKSLTNVLTILNGKEYLWTVLLAFCIYSHDQPFHLLGILASTAQPHCCGQIPRSKFQKLFPPWIKDNRCVWWKLREVNASALWWRIFWHHFGEAWALKWWEEAGSQPTLLTKNDQK